MSLCVNSIEWASVRYCSASYDAGAWRHTKCSSIPSGSAIPSRAISGAAPVEHPDQLFVSLGDVVRYANKDRQAQQRQIELPSLPGDVGLGDNPRNAHQHRHLGEGAELAYRVEGCIAMLDQPDRPAGEPD